MPHRQPQQVRSHGLGLKPSRISEQTLLDISRSLVITKLTPKEVISGYECTESCYPGIYAAMVLNEERTAQVGYVGRAGGDDAASTIGSRVGDEYPALLKGKHHNKKFQLAFNKNPESFRHFILEAGPHLTTLDAIKAAEIRHINQVEYDQPFMKIGELVFDNVILANDDHVEFAFSEDHIIAHFKIDVANPLSDNAVESEGKNDVG